MAGPGRQGPVDVAFVMLDGFNLTAEKAREATWDEEAEQTDTTGFGDDFREHTPTGLAKVTLEIGGAIFNTCSEASHEILSGGVPTSPQTAARLALIGVAGSSVGAECAAFEGVHQVGYKPGASLEDLVRANATYEVTGALEPAHVIHPLGEETTDGNTESTSFYSTGTGAGSTSPSEVGGVGHLHISAFDGGWDGLNVVIRDSSDDVSYADLITFASASSTTPSAQRVALGSTAEVQRYLATAWTFEGAGTSGAASFIAAFSRGSTF